MRKTLQLLCVAMLVAFASNALAGTLSQSREVWANIINTAKYGSIDYSVYYDQDASHASDTDYFIKANGDGLAQLHISNSYTAQAGQDNLVYADENDNADGTFYITTTGTKGYNDDVVLMVAVKPDQGQLPANFSIQIQAAGYEFEVGDYEFAEYDTEVINVTYEDTDFSGSGGYGPHTYKPGPNGSQSPSVWVLPLYTGQTDFTNGEYLVFIDLKVGNLVEDTNLDNYGAVKVDYEITGLTTQASFSAYAWTAYSNKGPGLNWTNDTLNASGTSSYRVVSNN